MQTQPDSPQADSETTPGPATGRGWMISTWILLVALIALAAFTFVRMNDLQQQVDDLTGTTQAQEAQLAEQATVGRVAGGIADQQISTLEQQVQGLAAATKTIGQFSAQALEAAADEYDKLQSELATTQAAAKTLAEEHAKADADTAAVTQAYEQAQQDLLQAQATLNELLVVLAATDSQ